LLAKNKAFACLFPNLFVLRYDWAQQDSRAPQWSPTLNQRKERTSDPRRRENQNGYTRETE
jgi:hypothetical protein